MSAWINDGRSAKPPTFDPVVEVRRKPFRLVVGAEPAEGAISTQTGRRTRANKKLRGKPYPDHLLYSLKKNKIKTKNAYFVGDTKIDFLASKRAKIKFIFAKYGYGEDNKLYKYKISNFKQIRRYIL